MREGLVFNIQKYSVHDGPGIRTTVFLKGCPLHCAWCHNPESISPAREMAVVDSRCLVCGECQRACPFGNANSANPVLPTKNERCTWCGACVAACPTQARQIIGRNLTEFQVLDQVLQDRIFYEESGGGVTFSGGEPLAQAAFLRAVLTACRSEGIHTAVDTCGLARPDDLLAIIPITDLFLYDLKVMDDSRHRQFTGVSNRIILENLQTLGDRHHNIWIRVPVVPGVNDAPADLEAIAAFAAKIPGVRQVNLLPYHSHGIFKSERLGKPNGLPRTAPPSPGAMQEALDVFHRAGLVTKIGG